jgi:flagellar biosynthesis/type III secretory pathway protein FliH
VSLSASLIRAPLESREDRGGGPGGALVETEAGRIDARLETQLAAVARAVEEALA